MVELRALGTTSLKGPDGNQLHSVLARPKLMGLLVVLASAPETAFLRRDTLLGLFWPEAEQVRARASLRQALYNLRQSLGADAVETRGEDEVRLNPAVVRSDVAAFRAALAEGEAEAGLELYRGDLLEGFFLADAPDFERWLDRIRGDLREEATQAARHLAEAAQVQGNAGGVGYWTRRALSLAPFDEGLLQKGMVLLADSGDRAGAIQLQVAFASLLKKELGLEPTEATLALAKRIATGEVRTQEVDGDHPPLDQGGTAPPGRQATSAPRPGWVRVLVTSVVLAGLLLVAWTARSIVDTGSDRSQGHTPPLSADSVSSTVVAILPFQAFGSDADSEELAAGVHEEILVYLSNVSGLRVLSRRSVAQYAQSDLTLREIAERSGAGSILEGSVQKEGTLVRITAQLMDATTDTQLWAQTFYREPRELLEVQVEIALRVAGTLRARLIHGVESGPGADSLIEALSQELLQEILRDRPEGTLDSVG
jgi:DNA-binding SARP family transcriptional activator/TolB-like protein